jgi:cold-inducible RNA-binding protein
MNTKLHVGNLAPTTTEAELHSLFSAHGNVGEVNLPMDRDRRQSLGIAVVTMATAQGAEAAIRALNGTEVAAHALTVNEAPSRPHR